MAKSSGTSLVIGVLMLLASLYALGGVYQAAALFVGMKALRNANLWGSIALVTAIFSAASFWAALRPIHASSPVVLVASGITLFVLAAMLIWPLLAEFVAVDGCLDAGGSYDYLSSACDFADNHPYLPVLDRQGFRLVGSVVFLFLGGVAFSIFIKERRLAA
jgi:hypothetical protein